MFWRRRREEAPADGAEPLPEIDLDAAEPDPADFDLPADLDADRAPGADGAPEPLAAPPAPEPLAAPPAPEPDANRAPEPEPEPVAAPRDLKPLFTDPIFAEPAPAPALNQGLARTRGGFMSRLRGYLGEEGDGPSWDDVEETLIAGDVGATLSMELVDRARGRRDPAGAEAAIRAELAALLLPRDGAWEPRSAVDGGPAIVLVVGVNGTGKTTTIGKLATRYAGEGRNVLLAAADTFRAAAIDQLMIWADRAGVPVVSHAPGADPGAVVYDALDAAIARGVDLVIADTAGRLHTKANLMDELSKIRRIVDKRLPGAVPETLFVLDATTGQNGLHQAKAFHDAVGLTGIVLTKLDSSAKGGIVFAIEHDLGVPVRFVGVGEKATDLLSFDPDAFVAALFD